RAWHRLAPDRRRIVAANLARVCAATGRPTAGAPFRAMVQASFVEHARYWLEVLRAPHYRPAQLEAMVRAEGWDDLEPIFRSGVVVAVAHLGNFEPFGSFMEVRGLRGIAPVEETRPAALYEFLLKRRIVGGRGIRLVPLSRVMRPMLAALRQGQIVALAADRDLAGDGLPVTIFGHATTLPAGPATLALRTGRPLLVASVLRTGRERFHGRAWAVEVARSGDLRADVVAMTAALAARFEAIIGEAPEQWWGAFQPFWSDQRR
ncbi:MAG: lysophospholipid acyltransferase family protein, partial [Candidatus Limnocylindria bacterium]